VENFFKDLEYSVRMLRHNRGFAFAAVAALALGIGANTAVFSVINSVILRPLSYPDPDRLIQFLTTDQTGSSPYVTVPELRIWKEQRDLFEDVSAYDPTGPALNLLGGGFPEQIQGKHVTADFFHLFGAPVILGRTFSREEDQPNGGYPVVLSEGFWRRRFGGDPRVLGKQISLGTQSYTIIGIVSSQFRFETPTDVFLPFQFDLNTDSQANDSYIAARLRPGVTLQMANARLRLNAEELRRSYTLFDPHQSLGVRGYKDSVIGDVRSSLLLLAGAVSLVLWIACANVATLLLVRATSRKREIAIRAAIGASRGRIIRQLLTESVLLSSVGGLLGLLLGWVGMHVLLALNPGDLPRIGQHGEGVILDWRVLAFTLVVSVGTGMLFGLIPALDASDMDLGTTLKESSGRSAGGPGQNKVRSLLVVSEMALALVLLIGAALLIRTYLALRSVDPGFRSRHVLTMQMSVQGTKFEKTSQLGEMIHQASDRLESTPGVEFVGTTSALPSEAGFEMPFIISGRPLNEHQHGHAGWMSISPHYFDAFRIPLIKGRAFTYRDDAASPPVVIISEPMARQFWPHSDPVGQRLLIGKYSGPEFADSVREIVGVTGGVRDYGLDQDPSPMMYLPVAQVPDSETALNAKISPMSWIVLTRADPHALSTRLQKKLIEASGGLPVAGVRPMDDVVANSMARGDFNMLLLTIFGASALLLASIGMYGLMSYSVEQRTQEIGIRLALGAALSDVRSMILFQGMRLALIGVAIGIFAALGLSRFLASFLFGVQKWDPIVFITIPVLLALVALLALWLPASRATLVDPVEALRRE
jgi:putative ABC transport system permease protein